MGRGKGVDAGARDLCQRVLRVVGVGWQNIGCLAGIGVGCWVFLCFLGSVSFVGRVEGEMIVGFRIYQ